MTTRIAKVIRGIEDGTIEELNEAIHYQINLYINACITAKETLEQVLEALHLPINGPARMTIIAMYKQMELKRVSKES